MEPAIIPLPFLRRPYSPKAAVFESDIPEEWHPTANLSMRAPIETWMSPSVQRLRSYESDPDLYIYESQLQLAFLIRLLGIVTLHLKALDQSIPHCTLYTMSSLQALPAGIYRISDGRGRWLSESGVGPGTGAGTQLVLLTEEEGTDAGFNARPITLPEYDKSQSAYTIQNAKSGLYASFEGDATENAHLGSHSIPRYYDLVSNGAQRLKVVLKGTKLSLNTSPCIMYPPMIALSTDVNAMVISRSLDMDPQKALSCSEREQYVILAMRYKIRAFKRNGDPQNMDGPPSPPLSAIGGGGVPEPSAVEPLPLLKPAGVFNHGSSPLFSKLTDLFEALRTEKRQEKRKTLLVRWFTNWREKVGTDLHPALRLILPEKDRERAVYGLKESSLAKCFLASMGIDPKSADGKRVLNWKKPTPDNVFKFLRARFSSLTSSLSLQPTVGDFPTTLYEVLAPRCPNTHGTLTVDRLNELLDDLTKCARNIEMQMRVVRKICDACTAAEQRWIVRIILKDLTIQVRETSVLGAFHPDARDLFNTCSDLKRVAWELWNPSRSLQDDERDVTLWTPFQPMLCKRSKTLAEAVKLVQSHMENGMTKGSKNNFVIEEKLDGERMQLHKRGNAYFYSSRKGTDYTYLYGAHVGTGSLTPYIHAAFDDRIEDCILDGEMMVWDPMLDKYLAFGTLKTAATDILGKIDTWDNESPRPCFKVFDILLLRNPSRPAPKNFSNTPLSVRRKVLAQVFKPIQGRLELAAQSFGSNAKDVESALEKIVEERGEGLVLKAPESPYVLAGREAFWVKVKPEYMDSMSDSVDLLVVAGKWGSGSRGGKVSSLVCAVRDDYSRSGVSETGMNIYATFVRVGTGLTVEDYDWVNKKKWIRMDKKSPPPHMKVSPSVSSDDKGDVYLDPEECKAIRRDLSVDDCLTWSGLRELHGGKRKDSDDRQEGPKRRKIGGRKPTVVVPDLTGNSIVSKAVIEKLIYQHGGDFTQVMQGDSTLTVIYGGTKLIPQVKRIMKRNDMDILKPQWLTDSIEKGRLVPLQAKYYFYATKEAQEDGAYKMNNEEVEVMSSLRSAKISSAKSPPDLDRTLSSSPEPEEIPEYLKPIPLDENITKIPDDPSASDTQSEPEDLADQLSDEEWTEIAATHTGDNHNKIDSVESGVEMFKEGSTEQKPVAVKAQAVINSGEDIESNTVISAMRSEISSTTSKLDQNLFFRNLCFYLDSPDNARDEDFLVSNTHESKIRLSMDRARKDVLVHGGALALGLSDPRLTHIVLHELDKSRRIELIRRTSKPKRRYVVLTSFISACVSEGTLLDEDAFMP
ncbi:DNA ligase, partial [Rhizoctonia solani]